MTGVDGPGVDGPGASSVPDGPPGADATADETTAVPREPGPARGDRAAEPPAFAPVPPYPSGPPRTAPAPLPTTPAFVPARPLAPPPGTAAADEVPDAATPDVPPLGVPAPATRSPAPPGHGSGDAVPPTSEPEPEAAFPVTAPAPPPVPAVAPPAPLSETVSTQPSASPPDPRSAPSADPAPPAGPVRIASLTPDSPASEDLDPAKQVCGALRLDLGAYVLGSLDETETHWVRSHVAVCPDCRAEYEELAVLPVFLARLTPAEAEASGMVAAPPPERLFEAAAVRVRRERRRRTVLLAAAAAAAIAVASLGWVFGGDDGGKTTALPPASPSVSASASTGAAPQVPPAPGARTVKLTDPRSAAVATVEYREVEWGTTIQMKLSGVAPGTRCQLDVYGTKGRQETASSWVVPDEGYEGSSDVLVPGATSIRSGEIVRFMVTVVGQGTTLLRGDIGQTATKSP
ncbi:zf-HC2 domain-containing protein [Yinghuangia seranimata]|uniref:zf-HC2 domain-containing protein n=1 Tax=Yinghuangia seranimata TaxID=408067 RepID=UPI00248C191A|nr:zf-HC2 domain-containing protein [Yinghuangia seranimata]MDI2131748.1 zf-HC2 domain-containing protein [Yinghuangia seranimata]